MKMPTLNARGHEVLDQTPIEVPVRMYRPLTVLDHQRIAMARARLEEAMTIKTDEDLARDLFDFQTPEEVDGLPFFTAYSVPDEVPDVYRAEPVLAGVEEGLQEVSQETKKAEVNQPSS